jgi:methionine synthase II (cobalamin-independent)
MFAREEGVPIDSVALAAQIRSAVAEVVRKQAEVGLDVINDGEFSKPSYATYVKDRLAGFGGTSHPLQYRDLVDFCVATYSGRRSPTTASGVLLTVECGWSSSAPGATGRHTYSSNPSSSSRS